MVIIDSIRLMASRGELACSVPMEPSWPVFIACNRSKASGPRTSPTMMRSGRIRRQFLTRSRMVIWPWPSRFGGRVSRRTTCGCCSCSSAASSQVMTRSVGSMKAVRVLSRVVLPEPVPPEMTRLHRAAPMTPRTRAPSGLMEAYSTRFFIVSLSFLNLRIVSVGPSMARGGAMTLTREPSGRRASQMGLDSSTRRPTCDTIRWQMFISWVLSRKRTLVSCTLPLTSMKTRPAPLTMMSAMSSRASSGSSGP
ncbi:hypothetical protein D3C86_1430620 [compost metagenome]